MKTTISLAMVALALGGCAVSNRPLMPHTPLRGQTEAQVQVDKRECTTLAEAAGRGVAPGYGEQVGVAFVPVLGAWMGTDSRGPAAENKAYKACMTERGYR
jgi:hypothetical protein